MLAVVVTTLRVTLPKLNQHKDQIETWVSGSSGFEFNVSHVSGFWRNTHPSISLKNLNANIPASEGAYFAIEEVEIEFDLIRSIFTLQPVIADLQLHNLDLDIASISLISNDSAIDDQGDTGVQTDPSGQSKPADSADIIQRLDNLLLRQVTDFELTNSSIRYQSLAGEVRDLDIHQLRWRNDDNQHYAEGEVSITEANINSLLVSANFEDHGSLLDISGEFYLSAHQVDVMPWLTKALRQQTGIDKGLISFNSWLTLTHSKPDYAYVDLQPSLLSWREQGRHTLDVNSGVLRLEKLDEGWQVSGDSLSLSTDKQKWPTVDFALDWQDNHWRLNLSQLAISRLVPLAKLLPDSDKSTALLSQFGPRGLLEDLRVAGGSSLEELHYSANLKHGTLKQSGSLPGFNRLQARISGNTHRAVASLDLIDNEVQFGDVFQAPLNIRQAHSHIVWETYEGGWRIWADKITAATADIQVLGEFRLDFPEDRSPFLSIYAEADVFNASQTWRYLPTPALGQGLTDYLSTAVQGGKAKAAQILWYGELGDFPYQNNDGIFQALVKLEEAKFSFDTAWPPITELQLDLLFENAAMFIDSHDATLMDVSASRVTGRIPDLAHSGFIEIEAQAQAEGNAVRDYMMSSPLVGSVGAALTALQVSGEVNSSFQLHIPFDNGNDARAWGYADLKRNYVEIEAPPMDLDEVSGRIYFDNDVVKAQNLKGKLLNQPMSLDFNGRNDDKQGSQGYLVDIKATGDWYVDPLMPYLGRKWLQHVDGHASWDLGVDLQLTDIGFTYQIEVDAKLNELHSDYPYPLNQEVGDGGYATLKASGDQEAITARLQLPNMKYQAEIDITQSVPVIEASNLVFGRGGFKISPVVGHHALIRAPKVDFDQWVDILNEPVGEQKAVVDSMEKPTMPLPERISVQVEELELATISWHDVDINGRKRGDDWQLDIASQEARGQLNYNAAHKLTVALKSLHVYVPVLDELEKEVAATTKRADHLAQDSGKVSEFDRNFHQSMPDIDLAIDDFWLQGYKVGKLDVDLKRDNDRLTMNEFHVASGTNHIDVTGWWSLAGENSHSQLNLNIESDNNSELMERFGIKSGIQKAPFTLQANTKWQGSPWSMDISTLEGDVSTKFGKGMISNVSGAARILGMFSLDSIVRRMQLDFSDVFDQGMAFNYIRGSGEIKHGIFITNDLEMDAIAGDMAIKGLANLNTRQVDAQVNFKPDITSGLPTLTAFAVAPQTALYVLAISTVISPVVEVFTQVNYSIKGPLDDPIVEEVSRRKGDFTLPEDMREGSQQ